MKKAFVGVPGALIALGLVICSAVVTFAQVAAPTNGMRRVDPGWHAIVHATLIPEPGQKIDDATIVMRDGVIVSVTPGGTAPEGARVWDCTGLTVYAGLVEPYATVDAPRPDRTAPGAHWNERVMAERSALDGGGLSKDARGKLRAMGYTAAAIAPADGIFRGTVALVSLADTRGSDQPLAGVIKPKIAHAIALDTGGRGADAYPSSKMGAIALVRQTLADIYWYQAANGKYSSDIEKGNRPQPCDTLAALDNDLPLLFDVGDELDAVRVAKIAREFNRQLLVVGSGNEYRRPQALAGNGLSMIVPLRFAEKPRVESPGDFEATDLGELMAWEQSPTNLRRLEEAMSDSYGGRVAITSSKLPKGQEFFANLRKAIEMGLSEESALAMLTTTPALMIGLERHGKVAPGYAASLVVVKGSLFDEKRKVRDVWVEGERYEITRAPTIDVEGTWETSLPLNATGAVVAGESPLKLTIKGDEDAGLTFVYPKPLAADAKPDAKPDEVKAKARNVSTIENRVSFLLDLDALFPPEKKDRKSKDDADEDEPAEDDNEADKDEPAKPTPVITLSAIVEGDTMIGTGTKPDGQKFTWTAARTSRETDKKKDDDKKTPPEMPPEQLGLPFGAYAYDSFPEQKTILVENATIWTSGPKGIIENGLLLVSGGKIQMVADPKVDPIPGLSGEVVRIDAKGKHITPGLIDCHSHTGISAGVNEGTQSCTAEVRIFDVIDPDAIGWYRELAGGITAVNQLHGSANAIGGQNSVVKLRWGCAMPDDMRLEGAIPGIKFALGENVKQSNWGERNTTRYPQTRMGVETFIRDRFTAARDYMAAMQREPHHTRRDLELEALAEILRGERLVHCHSYRQDEILMLCRVAAEFGFKIGTFQHVLEGYKVAEAIREHAIGGSAFSDWWAYKFEVIDAIPSGGAIMHDAGVVVSFNSDSDEMARRMNVEAAKAMKYGNLPPAEALKFVTINPARQLKIDHLTGSLEAGKDADFVIWSGNPLSSMSRCEATYVDGREMFSLARDSELRTKAASERQRLAQKAMSKGAEKGGRGGGGGGGEGRGGRRRPQPDTDVPEPELIAQSLRAGGRMMIPAGGDDAEIEAMQRAAMAHLLEEKFLYMIRNGLDPMLPQQGDCGCGIHSLFMMGETASW